MMKSLTTTAVALLALGLLATIGAQEGHPLKGSWLGEWKGNTVHGDNILLILDWDGKAITGMINPGTDNMPIKAASLEPKQLLDVVISVAGYRSNSMLINAAGVQLDANMADNRFPPELR